MIPTPDLSRPWGWGDWRMRGGMLEESQRGPEGWWTRELGPGSRRTLALSPVLRMYLCPAWHSRSCCFSPGHRLERVMCWWDAWAANVTAPSECLYINFQGCARRMRRSTRLAAPRTSLAWSPLARGRCRLPMWRGLPFPSLSLPLWTGPAEKQQGSDRNDGGPFLLGRVSDYTLGCCSLWGSHLHPRKVWAAGSCWSQTSGEKPKQKRHLWVSPWAQTRSSLEPNRPLGQGFETPKGKVRKHGFVFRWMFLRAFVYRLHI